MRFIKPILIVVVIIILVSVSPTSSVAEILYGQTMPDEPTAAFGSSDSTIAQKIADNFSLSGSNPSAIRSLRFIGGTGLTNPLPDEFRVVFIEDAGGLPGIPVAGGDFSIGSAFSRVPTGGELLNGVTTPIEYIVNLPSAVLLEPNTIYWLSITNNLLPASGWAWARGDGVFDQTIASTTGDLGTGPWVVGGSSGGMWFELNDQIIPEPSSIVFFLAALMTITLQRKGLTDQG